VVQAGASSVYGEGGHDLKGSVDFSIICLFWPCRGMGRTLLRGSEFYAQLDLETMYRDSNCDWSIFAPLCPN
jgi:hypothetical protein